MKRRIKFNLLLVQFLLIGNGILFSQELPPIVTDRPDITESAETVQKNRLQIESGILYNKYQSKNKDSLNRETIYIRELTTLPNVLFRYGVNNFMELRLGLALSLDNESFGGRFESRSSLNFDAPSIGVKFKLEEQDRVLPSTAIILQVVSPALSSNSFDDDYFDPTVTFCFQNTIAEKIGIGYNVGLSLDDGLNESLGVFYSLSGSYLFSNKVSVFAEYFGYSSFDTYGVADLGVTYLINNNIQIDLSGGINFEIEDYYFLNTGFSIRIPN